MCVRVCVLAFQEYVVHKINSLDFFKKDYDFRVWIELNKLTIRYQRVD